LIKNFIFAIDITVISLFICSAFVASIFAPGYAFLKDSIYSFLCSAQFLAASIFALSIVSSTFFLHNAHNHVHEKFHFNISESSIHIDKEFLFIIDLAIMSY